MDNVTNEDVLWKIGTTTKLILSGKEKLEFLVHIMKRERLGIRTHIRHDEKM